jgi:hypothetical protein
MTSAGQGLDIFLEGNCMEIFTHNYVVAIRGILQNVGLAPRSGTSIFDPVFLEIAFIDQEHVDVVSDLPRSITSPAYSQVGHMVPCWIRLCHFQLTM